MFTFWFSFFLHLLQNGLNALCLNRLFPFVDFRLSTFPLLDFYFPLLGFFLAFGSFAKL